MHYAFDERYQQLNNEQKIAVDTIEGPVIVLAGPGTGKTQILSMRVANILRQTDTLASSILCLTFTESARFNMRKRLRSIIGLEANKVAVHTFHSFGTEMINQNPEYFFFGADFRPADDLASISILEAILNRMPQTDPLGSFHEDHGWTYLHDIRSRITDLKKAGISPVEFTKIVRANRDFLEKASVALTDFFNNFSLSDQLTKWNDLIHQIECKESNFKTDYDIWSFLVKELVEVQKMIEEQEKPSTEPITVWKNKRFKKDDQNKWVLKNWINLEKYESLARVYSHYQAQLQQKKLFDFDDMLLEVVRALLDSPSLRFTYQEQFLYILVDEFQDTSGVQTKILDLLVNPQLSNNRPNLMVVGDDDQSIFKFQGASVQNLLDFKKKYCDVEVITLTKNYRSNQPILDFASSLIMHSQSRMTDRLGLEKNLVSQVEQT